MQRNILFIVGRYPNIGGVESITTYLSNEFVRQGYSVHIASFESCCDLSEMRLDKSVRLFKLSYPVYSRRNRRMLSEYIKK